MNNAIQRLTGAYVPWSLANYIALYALACNSSKSKIIRNVLKAWYEDRSKVLNPQVLSQNIASKYQQKWTLQKLEEGYKEERKLHVAFAMFRENVRCELQRYLKPEQIDSIISYIQI